MMKVCDIADWFAGDLASVIQADLHELPRFHRKQWEFAQTFIALRDAGALHADAVGISFGAGTERLLYALANRVGRLWATDLYDPGTVWPQARTSEIDGFVRSDPPFPTRTERLSVRDMDMRQITFPDESFDFAYSSSAVEHIGGWDDFRTHLAEVRRVLKPGGVYVMTTDIIYGPAWEQPGNYKFTPEGLQWWLQESGMDYEPLVDCRIAHHGGNAPLPADIMPTLTPDGGNDRPNLFNDLLQAQMLMGRHPHSSVILVMRKAPSERPAVAFPGYEDSKAFLLERRAVWDDFILRSRLGLHPAAYVPAALRAGQWATTYIFLGVHPRAVRVRVQTDRAGPVTIGVNKLHTDSLTGCAVDIAERIEMTTGDMEFEFTIEPEPDFAYAIYGRTLNDLILRSVSVTVMEPDYVSPGDRLVRRMAQIGGSAEWGGWDIRSTEMPREPSLVTRAAGVVNNILRPTGIRLTRSRWR
jgi:SAM-dependent methyltransferase